MKRENILKTIVIRYVLLFFAVLFVVFVGLGHCQVSPIMGLGNVQVFDNFGHLCPQCVIYSYQGGTTTQIATFTDATGTIQNTNPITFTSGARAAIWLTTGAFYKFVFCAQNDGSACAPADVLFTVDQVPGGSSGGGGGGSSPPFTSNSANPATTGILRLASGDSICWRNAANSANLCIAKDTSDVLNWAGGAIKFPQIACSNTGAGFDYLCASTSNNRWVMANNGGSQTQIVGAGVDINTSDQVTQLHFGATATPLGTAPTTNQYLQWNGTNIVGNVPSTTETSWGSEVGQLTATGALAQTFLTQGHTLTRFTAVLQIQGSSCSTTPVVAFVDSTASSTLTSLTLTNGVSVFDSGALSIATTAGHSFQIQITRGAAGCGTFPSGAGITAVTQ